MKHSGNLSFFKFCVLALMFLSYGDVYVIGAPKGGHVVSGTASFAQDGNLTVITAGNRSIINYGSFNIAQNETVRFVQPNAHATVLNRITDPNPTNIFGQLQANGIVVIANPYGVFFQNGAVINVGGLYAGAGKISDADFTAGRIHFTDLAGDVRNDGVIAADNRIALMGANIVNTGTVSAARGVAMMVSGKDVYVGEKNGNIFVQANGASLAAGASSGSVNNSGKVMAPRVVMGAGDMYSTAIVNSGLLQGRSVTVNAGQNGSATVSGTIDASSARNRNATGSGGRVQVLGGTVALQGAKIDASGKNGGSVRVGGDLHGGGTLLHAQTTTVDAATKINADAAGANGNGGSVVVWSDATTNFAGQISARGGSGSGDGGSAEVSSHDKLAYSGFSDLRAPAGKLGSLLLDPHNITIATGGAALAVGQTFAATPDQDVTISPTTLATSLNGANITLQANNDIFINNSVDASTGVLVPTSNGNLMLQAGRSITFAASVALTLKGSLMATFNDGAADAHYRDPNTGTGNAPARFFMDTGSSITAPGGVTIQGGNLATYTGGAPATVGDPLPAPIASTISANTGDITVTTISTSAVNGGNILITHYPGDAAANPPVPALTGKNITVKGNLTTTGVGTPAQAGPPAVVATAGSGGTVTIVNGDTNTISGNIVTSGTGTTGAGGAAGNGGNVQITAFTTNTLSGTITANGTGTNATGGNISIAGPTSNSITAGVTTNGTGTGSGGTVAISGGTNAVAAITSTGTGATPLGGAVSVVGTVGNTLNGAISGGSFTTNATGSTIATTFAPGSGVTTTGAQNYFGPVILNQATGATAVTTTLAAGGNVTFNNRVDGPTTQTTAFNSLTITGAGNQIFNGRVGNQFPLLNLTSGNLGAAGTTQFNMAAPTATTNTNGGVTLAGALTVNDKVSFAVTGVAVPTGTGTPDHASVVTTGAQLYKGNALLAADTYLSSGTTLEFDGSINRDAAVAVGTGSGLTLIAAGATTLTGAVGTTGTAIDSLTVTGGALLNLYGPVTTAGPQNYNEPVAVGGNITLNGQGTAASGGVAVRFGSTVNSSAIDKYMLTLANTASATAGVNSDTVFVGAVGDTSGGRQALSRLTTSTVGTTQINGGSVTTSDMDIGQVYRGATTIGTTTVLSAGSGSINFNSTLGSTITPQALTVSTSGTTTFGMQVGGVPTTTNGTTTAVTAVPALASLSVTGGPVSLSGGVTTVTGTGGTQSYTGQVTLTGDTILTGNSVTFTTGFLAGGGHNLTLNLNSTVTVDGNPALMTPNIPEGGIFRNLANFTANVVSASSKITLDGLFSTSGSQTYYPVVNLSATTTLRAGTGGVTFNAALTSTGMPYSLAIGTASAPAPSVTFNGPVGTTTDPLLSLTVTTSSGGAGTTIGGALTGSGTVVTRNSQTYGALTLGVNSSLIAQSAGSGITVTSLTGKPGATAFNLTVTAPGSTFGVVNSAGALDFEVSGTANFNGNIGNTTSLTLGNAAGTVAFGASATSIATSGFQTYNGVVTVAGTTTTFGNSSTGDITFNKTLDGGVNVVVNSGGNEIFNGLVGSAATPLVSLTTDSVAAAGQAQFNMNVGVTGKAGVTTSGAVNLNDGVLFNVTGTNPVAVQSAGTQTYAGVASLNQNTTLSSSGTNAAGNVTFSNTLDAATNNGQSLTVNTAGLTAFNGAVGTSHALNQLTTNNAGAADLGTIFNFAIPAGLTTGVGGVNASTVTINDPVTFQISGATAPSGPNAAVVYHPSVNAASQTYAAVTLQADTVLRGSTLSFASINGKPGATAYNLTLDASTPVFTLPNTTITNVNNFAIIDATLIQIGGTFTTIGSQYYGAPVTLTATTNLTSGMNGVTTNPATNNITFNSTLNGPFALTLNPMTGGSAVFNGVVGTTTANYLASLTVNGPTSVTGGGMINTTGFQNYAGTLTLGLTTTLNAGSSNVTVTGATTGTGGLTVTAGSANFAGINLPGALTFSVGTGNVTVTGTTTGVSSLLVNAGSSNFTTISSNGGITFNDGAGNATVTGSTTATNGLTVNAGSSNFAGIGVGGDIAFNIGTGLATFSGNISGASFTRTGTGTTSFGGATVTTTTGQTYGGPLSLTSAAATLTDGAIITFTGTVNGNSALTVNAPSTIFSAAVGNSAPLKSLVTDANGTTQINGGSVATQGLQSYNDKVTLGSANVTLSSTNTNADGGAITFFNTLDGAAVLNVNTPGDEIFKGLVGNGTALLGLNTDAAGTVSGQAQFLMDLTGFTGKAGVNVAGNVAIKDQALFGATGASTAKIPVTVITPTGTNTPTIRSTGSQTYSGTTASLLGADTVLQGLTIVLTNGVNGSATPFNLTLDFTGTQTYALGTFTNLKNLAFVGGGTTQLGGTLAATTGFLYFANPVALTGATVLNSSAGNVVFDGTLNGPSTLAINTPGDEIFNNLVGNTSVPASLTIDTTTAHLGSTRFNQNLTTLGATVAVQIGSGGLTINDATVFNVAGIASTTPTQVSVQSTGGQTYNGDSTLTQNTVLTSKASGTLLFAGKLDGTFNLTLNSGGNEQFNKQVGSTNPLLSLSTDADGIAADKGGAMIFNVTGLAAGVPAVTTVNNAAAATGAQTYNDAVLLGADTVLSSSFTGPATTGGAVTFNGTVDTISTAATPLSLTVLAGVGQTVFKPSITVRANQLDIGGAQVIFNQSVGGNRTLNLLRVGSSGTLTGVTPSVDLNSGVAVSTTLGQVYQNRVYLSADTVLSDTGGNDITFTGKVDGDASVQHSLTLNTTGRVIFQDLIGDTTPLSLLSSTSGLGTQFNMDASTAAANHGGVNVGAGGVTVNGPVSFNVAGVSLSSLLHPSIQSAGPQTYNGLATLSRDTLLSGTAGAAITFNSTVNNVLNGTSGLAVNTSGNEMFNGLVGNTAPLNSLTTDNLLTTAAGQTQFNMNVTGQTAGIAGVRVGAGGLLVNDNVVFKTTGSSVTNPSVLVYAGGTQTYKLAADVQTDTVLVGDSSTTPPTTTAYTGGGLVTFNGALASSTATSASLTIRTGVGPTTFSDTVLVNALDVTGANVLFVGKVGKLGTLLIAPNGGLAGGPININGAGNSVTSSLGQIYRSAVVLGTNALLADTGTGNIVFNGTVDADGLAARTLTLNGLAQVIFNRLVGDTNRLNTLTSTAVGTQFNMDAGTAMANNGGVNVGGGGVTINGGTTFNIANSTLAALTHPSVLSVGGQTYNGATSLGLDTSLVSSNGADLVFNGTVDGAQNLVLNTGGNEVFFGLVGNTTPLASLLVDNLVASTGQTQFNMNAATASAGRGGVTVGAGGVTINDTVRFNVANSSVALPSILTLANGPQLYKAAATLGSRTFLTGTGNSPITFQSTVDGAYDLTLNTGSVVAFGGLVGSTTAPLSLVSTASATQFNMNVAGQTTGTAGVNVGAGGITINGLVTFNVANASLNNLTHPAVQTVGAQTYNGGATLLRDTSLSGTAGANVTFNATVDGGANLTVDTAGNQIFNGLVGNTSPLISLALDTLIAVTGGQTQFNMNAALASAGRGGVTVGAGGLTVDDTTVYTVANSTVATPSVLTINGGTQVYNGAARLAADTVLRAAAGADIVFNSTVRGMFNLLTNSNGATRFNAAVGDNNNPLASLTTGGNGQTIIAGGSITTVNNGTAAVTGRQTYNEEVILTHDATLASVAAGGAAAGGDITFNQSVSGPLTLTVNTGARTVFNGPVGASSQGPLAGLVTDAPGATQFNLDLTAAGASAYPAAVVVNGPVTINDAVVFNVTGGSLTQPTVLTLGDGTQSYNGLTTLNTSTFLVSATALPAAGGAFAGGGLISFGPAGITSGGGQNLYVRTAVGTTVLGSTVNVATLDLGGARVTFNGAINLPGGLLSVEPNGGGTGGLIQFNGGGLTTAGTQRYNVGVILGADSVFTSLNTTGDGGDILFTSTVDSDGTARSLTLNTSGDEIFNGIVGGNSALLSLTTDSPGPVGGTARFNMDLNGANAGVAGVNVSGAVMINDDVRFNVAGSSLGSSDHPSIQTGGAQIYNGAAILAKDTSLSSLGAGAIIFNRTLDGASALSLFTSGNDVFNGIVGGTTALTSLDTGAGVGQTRFNMDVTGAPVGVAGVNTTGNVTVNNRVLFNVAGTTLANGQHASVLTGGAQTYAGAATLSQDTALTSSGAGAVTFGSTVDGAFGLALSTTGDMVFNGLVGSSAAPVSLTTGTGTTRFNMSLVNPPGPVSGVRVAGPVVINGAVVFTVAGSGTNHPTIQTLGNAAQTYNGAATLSQDTVLTSSLGAITLNSTLDGASAFTINTGAQAIFNAPVGGGTALTSLTTSAAGGTQINGGSVRTSGFQTYNGTVTLSSANGLVTLSSLNSANDQGAITFANTLDGAVALNVDTSGDTLFNGAVTLGSLATSGGGATRINGGSVSTTGTQSYGDAVAIGADTALTAANASPILFGNVLSGPHALTIQTTGLTTFVGTVGGADDLTALASLRVNGPTEIDGGSVRTTGFQNYVGAVQLGQDTLLASTNTAGADAITFASTVKTVANPAAQKNAKLSLVTPGRILFGNTVSDLTSLSTSRASTTVFFANGGNVTTSDAQTYNGSVLLRVDANLISTGRGTIRLGGEVNARNGQQSLVLTTRGGEMIFGGRVGGAAGDSASALRSISTSGGTTRFQGDRVTTNGKQEYGGPAVIDANATLVTTTGGKVLFDGTVDDGRALNTTAHALTINSSADTTFADSVGGAAPLLSLEVTSAGATNINGAAMNTTDFQLYNTAVILGNASRTDLTTQHATTNGGTITFRSTVDGTVDLHAATTDGLFFRDNVGQGTALRSLYVSGNTGFGDSGAPTGDKSATAVGDMRFFGNVSAPQDKLTMRSSRIMVEGNMDARGNLDLETDKETGLIYLAGNSYVSQTGDVQFNIGSGTIATERATSTIVLTDTKEPVTIKGNNFTMGNYQKMYSQGTLNIVVGNGTAKIGDIAARNDLRITAGTVDLLGRLGGVSAIQGRSNDGLNFVAKNSINFGKARVIFDASSTGKSASFITTNGNVTIQRVNGVSIFKDSTLNQAGVLPAVNQASLGGDDFLKVDFSFFDPIQPLSGGSKAQDTAAALSGALPDQKPVDVAADITITASQLEELKKLGIHPRLAQKSERAALASKRALFAQLVDGQDTANYGRLQPVGSGVSQLVPSDFVVVVDRMGEREVSAILKAFEELYGKNKEKAAPMGESFQTAFNDYTVEKQTADPEGFSPYLQSNSGKYPAVNKAVRNFDSLFGYIEHLGLTDKEVAKSEAHIVSDLGVSGLSAEDMVKVIKDLRKKLPAEQKAPSTKLPPSAPASAPAPGASAPATAPTPAPAPAKKADVPPKTAEQDAAPAILAPKTVRAPLKKDSPRKTARQLKEVKQDYHHEVAGL